MEIPDISIPEIHIPDVPEIYAPHYLSIISFVMVASMSGGAYFGYKYVTSEQFKAKVMNQILGNVQGMMPKLLDNGLPKMTGPSMPIIK